MKTRTHPEHNYKGIHIDGDTLRIAIDPRKPITRLTHPEFFDVKVTSWCSGGCSYCYQSSTREQRHDMRIIERFNTFFGSLSDNERPFQIAFGGGEPTAHPLFAELLEACCVLGITPNYTTNGEWAHSDDANAILDATVKYCGGVAVSTHAHLNWQKAVDMLLERGVFTNLHVIIGDRASIDAFAEIYKRYHGRVKYFVLLPLSKQGRSDAEFSDWEYLSASINGSPSDVAFGANFHKYLVQDAGRFRVSLYEPESMSAYLDLETGLVTESSFSNAERIIPGRSIVRRNAV